MVCLEANADRPEQADRPRGERAAILEVAGSTGLEPAASGVTGRRSNQLNYDPAQTFECNRKSATRSSVFAVVRRPQRRAVVGGAGFEPATTGV